MSLNRIYPEDLEYFQLETNPKRTYSSSSLTGEISGAINLYAIRSESQKDVHPAALYLQSSFGDSSVEQLRLQIVNDSSPSTDIESKMSSYLDVINQQSDSAKQEQQLFIYRFTPPPVMNSNTFRKNVIRNLMYPYYRSSNPRMQWNTTNYNSLNFFSASNVPTSSVLIYSNPTLTDPNKYRRPSNVSSPDLIYNTGDMTQASQYQLSGAFTFDFWIKPTQTQEYGDAPYVPGGIFHMSGAYSVSLHSGSSRDENGLADRFRICFQYGNGTTVPNNLVDGVNVDDSVANSSYVVWSSDNVLLKNNWHHVTIRWPGTNPGTGSIVIDETVNTYYSCSSDTLLSVGVSVPVSSGYSALFVGNYYNGSSDVNEFFPSYLNGDDIQYAAGASTYVYEQSSQRYLITTGSYPTLSSTTAVSAIAPGPFQPSSFVFDNPLMAEVHELKLFNKYLTMPEIITYASGGVGYFGPNNLTNLKFYVPPFFTYESPIRSNELFTPFQTSNSSSTNTPFAVRLAYGIYGHNINLENYTRDFACDNYPILWNLTQEELNTPTSTPAISANEFLYATGSNIKRLYTILPCDNGKFIPNFTVLKDYNNYRFRNDLGTVDYGVISLNNITTTASYNSSIALGNYTTTSSQDILNNILGATPENLSEITGSSLAVLHRTRDTSSNQVVIFDISNIFYGKQIKPGTIVLTDSCISGPTPSFANGFGKQNNLGITLKDDGNGNLYRANCISGSVYPTWSSVGNVLYNEGLIVIKNPQLYFFGENQFELSFKGLQNIHVMTLNAVANAGTLISSSNTSFSSSLDSKPNEDLYNQADQTFVYITGINIHDENLNVIMKTNLAQGIQKLSGDRIVFRQKLDW